MKLKEVKEVSDIQENNMDSFKALLIQIASGTSFVLGTNIIHFGGIFPFIIGCIFYLLGYILMDKYKRTR